MNQTQKTTKIVSIIVIVLSAIGIFASLAVGLLGTLAVMTTDANAVTVGALAVVLSVLMVLECCLELALGVTGVRAANNPRKARPFYILSIICTVSAVAIIVMDFATGSFSSASTAASACADVVIPAICWYCADKLQKEFPAR